ncbi:ABC transporter permease [Dichotomicrobium thermohalophilum]|uniref:Phospholipid/cholesterol/gamma-HCH transport system permease protein n=1 Tax=Dichotomicrobium thermohalophilum TaxID=933063 RepID=A0A397Q1F1_9HYPH|nr:MlaE family lipid ABC transporter permease subunit [Dichotomicrobium thermohalophilum]RIA55216.1 phospholipid/cholesterol/gamma-HCH transport system permease protein [Dichotomicrobium thermohalophilum]
MTAVTSSEERRPSAKDARFVRFSSDGGARLALSGDWTVRSLSRIERDLAAATPPPPSAKGRPLDLDLGGLGALDTAGAWRLLKLINELTAAGHEVTLRRIRDSHSKLLREIHARRTTEDAPPPHRPGIIEIAGDVVRGASGFFRDAAGLTTFLGTATAVFLRLLAMPWRFRAVSFVHHLEHVGLRAIPIISLICFLIGAVVMQQSIVQLRAFGAETFSVNMLGILSLREVGILLVSIIVAGRSASAFTAEIGTMKMREEIDAMRTMGIDPMETLVMPRLLALLVAMPLLTFWGDLMCLAGGAAMASIYLGYDLDIFAQRLHDAINLRHFLVGIVKAPFAALIIALVGCLEGLRVQGSAESLGLQVTRAVVKAIFLVIIMDAVFAIFLSAAGY